MSNNEKDLFEYFNQEENESESLYNIGDIEPEKKDVHNYNDKDNFDIGNGYGDEYPDNSYNDDYSDENGEIETDYEYYDYMSLPRKIVFIVSYIFMFFFAWVGAICLIIPSTREALLSII